MSETAVRVFEAKQQLESAQRVQEAEDREIINPRPLKYSVRPVFDEVT